MILAFDTYYFENKAKTVCIGFDHWQASAPTVVYVDIMKDVEAYTPGEFYRRELPCIVRACSGFWFDGENELKFTPMRREKRSVAALHEHFCNEMGVNFSHLQLEPES